MRRIRKILCYYVVLNVLVSWEFSRCWVVSTTYCISMHHCVRRNSMSLQWLLFIGLDAEMTRRHSSRCKTYSKQWNSCRNNMTNVITVLHCVWDQLSWMHYRKIQTALLEGLLLLKIWWLSWWFIGLPIISLTISITVKMSYIKRLHMDYLSLLAMWITVKSSHSRRTVRACLRKEVEYSAKVHVTMKA